MDRVGVFEAKARLSELIARAERGQETTITRSGKVVARLVPAAKAQRKNPNVAVIDRITAFSKALKIKGRVNIRDLIEDGRE
ncbi:MAG: type II toxin-antitoxin system prevent-host-death family antitoxin [Betaproteobacteria bacterium]|nr:type II toxin-antitoxin system prevent-host-death family antitoxin [Betaproteobacteria bacterium]